jgi:hypothetical protein
MRQLAPHDTTIVEVSLTARFDRSGHFRRDHPYITGWGEQGLDVISCGLPRCGCGKSMNVAHPRDLAVIDPDQFEQLAGSLSKAAHNAMMRDCGFDAMILRDKGHDPVVARMRASRAKRCAAEGCGRFAAKHSLTRAQHGDQGIPF